MSDELEAPKASSSNANKTDIGGNVTTGRDFVGRDLTVQGDQVQGDKVAGDKITVNIHRLDPTDARNQRNHATMRQLVRKFWIDGVLRSSLYNEVLIRLNLTEQPKDVDNRPWDLILQQPGQPNYALPAGTPIIDVFDRMNQRLLILGEPGSGKTTMLLELADALLKRADADPTHPTPVVFNLSSWSEQRQPLAEWLVDELRTKYNIPKKIAQKWIDDDELLLLLDGLDEVQQNYRNECVEAINRFRQEHLVPIGVCSRVTEYGDLTVKLKLQGAVLIQPLTLVQIDQYLDRAGGELLSVRVTLKQDKVLQEMATSPLLLSIIVMAYHGVAIEVMSFNSSPHLQRQHLFNAYVKRMFLHRGYRYPYPIQKTIHRLSWLAKNMNQRQQTMFLIERLQPEWLQRSTHIGLYKLFVGLGFFLGGCMADLLVFSLVAFLSGVLGNVPTSEVPIGSPRLRDTLNVMLSTILFFLLVGLRVMIRIRERIREPVEQVKFGTRKEVIGRQIRLVICLASGAFIMRGIGAGAFWGFLVGFLGTRRIEPVAQVKFNGRKELRDALASGLAVSLVAGLIGLLAGGLRGALVAVLVMGPGFGFILLLSGLLELGEISQTTYPNQGIWLSAQNILAGGGEVIIKHFVLRLLLWRYKHTPLNYARFLDYCHDRLFLRKVGGGYIFIHRMLLEHFASLTDEDIKRIAADVEASRS